MCLDRGASGDDKVNIGIETLSTVVYLTNRSPTKAVKSITPFKAFHGKKPDVGHHVHLGVCIIHIAKDERKKLNIVVGCGIEIKGY